MKPAFAILFLIIIIPLIYFFFLGKKSSQGEALGLIDNQLAKCPETPNCVCSEYTNDTEHYIQPIPNADQVKLQTIGDVIRDLGGRVQKQTDLYLSAIFVSKIFKFVDDVEFRFDSDNNIIHIRSASRVGRSDMGINLKRIDTIKERLDQEKIKPDN